MRIHEMISQHRRDFTAIMRCEFCGHQEKESSGYDDTYYHTNVIPNMKCENCNKSTISEGAEIKPQATKYPDNYVI